MKSLQAFWSEKHHADLELDSYEDRTCEMYCLAKRVSTAEIDMWLKNKPYSK